MECEKEFQFELIKRILNLSQDIEEVRDLALNLLEQNKTMSNMLSHAWWAEKRDK